MTQNSPRKVEAGRELAVKSFKVSTMMVRTASQPECPTNIPGRLIWILQRGWW